MKIKRFKCLLSLGALMAMAMFAAPTFGQVTTTLIDDDFGDGQGSNTGDATAAAEANFFTTSSPDGISTDPALAVSGGGFRFISGSSGRAIHTLFSPTTLATAGDQIEVTFDFTTPTSVRANGNDEEIRFGLFDTSTTSGSNTNVFTGRNATAGALGTDTGTPIDFNGNISSGSSNNQPGLELAGFTAEIDIEGDPDDDIEFRVSDITGDSTAQTNGVAGGLGELEGNGVSGNRAPSGRLTTTTGGFDGVGSGPDIVTPVTSLTDYTGTLSIQLLADGNYAVTSSLAGGGLIAADTLASETILATAGGGTEAGLDTGTFDLLTFSVSSDAFGTINSADADGDGVLDDDNGITFTNVTVVSSIATAIPEPSSVTLLGLLGCAGLIRRRR